MDKRYRFLALLTLLIAFALRVWGLDARSLWLDEGMEYWVSASPTTDLLRSVEQGIQDPPLYSILLHLWMNGGHGEFYLRFPSVCFSLLSVSGIILLGRRLFGWTTGLLGGALMALLPAEIRYAQEVGQYALMESMIVWNLIALERILHLCTWRAYGEWVLSALLGIYSYYGAALTSLVLLGYTVAGDLLRKKKSVWKKYFAALALYGAGALPLSFFLSEQLYRGPTSQAFQSQFASPLKELENWWHSTEQLLAFQFTGWPWTKVPIWVPTLLIALALATAILYGSKQVKRLLGWLVAVGSVYYLVSRFGLFPYGFRYSLILTPLLVLVFACGVVVSLSTRRLRPVGLVLLAAVLGLCVLSWPHRGFRERVYAETRWAWPETEELGPLVQFWSEHRRDLEPTFVYYGAVPAFRYYLGLYGQENRQVFYGEWFRSLSPEEKLTSIWRTLGGTPERLWIVFSHVHPGEQAVIMDQLSADYEVILYRRETGAAIYLLGRR